MSRSTLAAGIRCLRRKLAPQGRHEDSDEQLLHEFCTRRDDSAFAVLVRRHGPMVLHVCRGVLRHHQDAEDAFQATFLALARNAATLRDKTMLAGFLHGTAYRTAMKAKQSAARRRKHESAFPRGAWERGGREPVDPADELSWREVRVLLDEELVRLPETYRSVFVLCCLEELSQAEAGRRLGLKERTVSRRLAAARKRLAQRLARRGVELTAALTASTLAAQAAAALPAGLIATTIEAASALATGEGVSGIVSASVAGLAQSATVAMIVSKAKLAIVVLLIVAISGLLVGWYGRASRPLAATAALPAAKTDPKPRIRSPKRQTMNPMVIQGRVLGPDGKPKAGAKLLLFCQDEKIVPLGVSVAEGRFTVAVPKRKGAIHLIARMDGAGIDFIDITSWKAAKPVELRLVKDHAIHGRVVNTEGKPVRGVRVSVRYISIGEKSLWFDSPLLFADTTDSDGRFVLHGIGVEQSAALRIHGPGIADAVSDNVVNRSDPDVTIIAEAEKPIRGVVREADTGKGRPNVIVRLTGTIRRDTSRHDLLHLKLQAKTDADGRYEIHAASKAKSYMVEVASDPMAAYLACQIWADDTPGYQPVTADITVKKGVIVTGKVIDGATGKTIQGFVETAALLNNPFAEEYPTFDSTGWGGDDGNTGADGSFRLVTIPGPVLLMGGLPRTADYVWPRRLSFRAKRKPGSAARRG